MLDAVAVEAGTRAEQIFNAFARFHKANPLVWQLFSRFTFEAIGSGIDHYSSDAICHRIRWHTTVETRGGTLKINDHFTAYYARMFQAVYEQHAGFFRDRRRISAEQEAHPNDCQEFVDGPPGGEGDLLRRLRALAGASTLL